MQVERIRSIKYEMTILISRTGFTACADRRHDQSVNM